VSSKRTLRVSTVRFSSTESFFIYLRRTHQLAIFRRFVFLFEITAGTSLLQLHTSGNAQLESFGLVDGFVPFLSLVLFPSPPSPSPSLLLCLSLCPSSQTASGILHSPLLTPLTPSSSSLLANPTLLHFPTTSSPSTQTPISMTVTQYHYLLLYSDRVCAVGRLDERLVWEERLPLVRLFVSLLSSTTRFDFETLTRFFMLVLCRKETRKLSDSTRIRQTRLTGFTRLRRFSSWW